MGKAIKQVGSVFGFTQAGSPGPKLNESIYDQRAQVDERTKQSRDASLALMGDLQKQARGEGPSLAGEQLKSASSRNLAQTLAAAAAQRGGNPALAQRNIMQQKGQADRQVAEQSALARMQEQQAAQGQLATLAINQQGQDIGQIMQPAHLRAQGEEIRFAQDVARRNAVKAQQQEYLNAVMEGASNAAMAASDERNKMPLDRPSGAFNARMVNDDMGLPSNDATSKSGKELADEGFADFSRKQGKNAGFKGPDPALIQQAYANMPKSKFSDLVAGFSMPKKDSKGKDSNFPGGGIDVEDIVSKAASMFGGAGSDKKNKKNVSNVSPKKDIKDFLDKLEARSYMYKDTNMPGTAEGKRYGIMAQDLEKSEVGKTIVKDTDNGKVVDTVQGFGTVLAAQAELNNRLKKLEKGKK